MWKILKDDYRSGNKDAKPDVQTCNTLINAWSKSGNHDAPIQAELLLKEIIGNHLPI